MPEDINAQISAMMNYTDGLEDGDGDEHSTEGDSAADGTGAEAQSAGTDEEISSGAETGGEAGEASAETGAAQAGDDGGEEGAEGASGDGEELSVEEENALLRERLQTVLRAQQAPGESPATEEQPRLLDDIEINPFEGVPDEDLEDIPESARKAVAESFKKFGASVQESLLRNLPQFIKSQASETVSAAEAAREFYDSNDDLKPYKPYVAFKLRELHAAEPDKGFEDLLGLAAKAVRKDLGLRAGESTPAARKNTKPPLKTRQSASSRRSRKAEPQLSAFEQELDAMEKALDQ